MLDASERSHDRPGGHLPAPHEHSDIAGRALEDNREVLVGVATRPGAQVQRREARDPRRTRWRVARRPLPGSRVVWTAMRDAMPSLRERVSMFGERGARGRKLTIVAQEPSHDELARGPSSEWLGDHKQVLEALRVGCDDQDRALSRRSRAPPATSGPDPGEGSPARAPAGPGSARCRARRRAAAASRDRPRAPRPVDPNRRVPA